MNFELFIARRIYADSEGGKRFSRPAIRIATAGIAVGLMVMIVSLAVVMGFKREVSSKVIGFGSHVQVLSLTQTMEYEMLPVLTNDSLERAIRKERGIDRMSKFASKVGMLKTDDAFCGLSFMGIGEDYDTTFLAKNMKEGTLPHFSSDSSSNQILISRRIASELGGVKAGDKIFAYFIGEGSLRARRFKVQGIYETNLTDYDRNYCFTDIHTVRKLNNWDADMSSGYYLTVKNFDELNDITLRLRNRIGGRQDRNGVTYGVYSIRELAAHTFAWLDVLDMNVIMILILMVCVSSFTIVSGLLIIMLERISMIGLLKALGATNMSVRRVFIHFSIMLVGKGLIIGNALGLLCCYVQDRFAIVKLDPSVYYIDSVPIELNWLSVVIINIATLAISALVIFGSSFFISISKPARSMRFE